MEDAGSEILPHFDGIIMKLLVAKGLVGMESLD